MRTLETIIRLRMFNEAKEAFEKKKAKKDDKKVGSKDELAKIKKDVAQLKKDVKSQSVDDDDEDDDEPKGKSKKGDDKSEDKGKSKKGDDKSKVPGKDKSKKGKDDDDDDEDKVSKGDSKQAPKKGEKKSGEKGKDDKQPKFGEKPGDEPADGEVEKPQDGEKPPKDGQPPAAPPAVKSQAAEKKGQGKEPVADDKVKLNQATPVIVNPTMKDTENNLAAPNMKAGPDNVNEDDKKNWDAAAKRMEKLLKTVRKGKAPRKSKKTPDIEKAFRSLRKEDTLDEIKINDKLRAKVEKRQHVTDYGVNFKIKGKHLRDKFKKNLKAYVKGEETEQIDELSVNKMREYKNGAYTHAKFLHDRAVEKRTISTTNNRILTKRAAGHSLAKKKIQKKVYGEEQIDELTLAQVGRVARHALAGPNFREKMVSKLVQKAKDSKATKDRGRRARQLSTMKQSRQGMAEHVGSPDWLASCKKLHNLRVELVNTKDPSEYKRIYDEIGVETDYHLKTFALTESREQELIEIFGWVKKLFGKKPKGDDGPLPKKITTHGQRRPTHHHDMNHMDHFHQAVAHHRAYIKHLDSHVDSVEHLKVHGRHMDKDQRKHHKLEASRHAHFAKFHRDASHYQMRYHIKKAPAADVKANHKLYKQFLDESFLFGAAAKRRAQPNSQPHSRISTPKPRKAKNLKPRLTAGVVLHAIKRFGKGVSKYSHHPVEKMLGLENAKQYNRALLNKELSENETPEPRH